MVHSAVMVCVCVRGGGVRSRYSPGLVGSRDFWGVFDLHNPEQEHSEQWQLICPIWFWSSQSMLLLLRPMVTKQPEQFRFWVGSPQPFLFCWKFLLKSTSPHGLFLAFRTTSNTTIEGGGLAWVCSICTCLLHMLHACSETRWYESNAPLVF